jgi:hypothetical protein
MFVYIREPIIRPKSAGNAVKWKFAIDVQTLLDLSSVPTKTVFFLLQGLAGYTLYQEPEQSRGKTQSTSKPPERKGLCYCLCSAVNINSVSARSRDRNLRIQNSTPLQARIAWDAGVA